MCDGLASLHQLGIRLIGYGRPRCGGSSRCFSGTVRDAADLEDIGELCQGVRD